MKIKKILIVPTERAVFSGPKLLFQAKARINSLRNRSSFGGNVELQFYGDIPFILGKENTFVLGKLQPHFFSTNITDTESYPSARKMPIPTYVSSTKSLVGMMRSIDIVLISVRAGELGKAAVRAARDFGIPVALIDAYDHEHLYGKTRGGVLQELTRGFEHGKDFDLYIKKDLLLGFRNEHIIPCAPIGIRPESFSFVPLPKSASIFYSGRSRPASCQGDRIEAPELIKKHFNNARIEMHDKNDTFISLQNYWSNLSSAKFALSPAGKVWDSYRHTETGLAPLTALIAPRPYIETVGPPLIDEGNAILYDTELRSDGKYHLIKEDEIIDKIRYYLHNDSERERIAARWQREVLSGHTILARSRYILESIEKIM